MYAMAEHEGYTPPGPNTPPGGSRAYRNHNPGNLRASPFCHSVVDGYCIFKSERDGWYAFEWDLRSKVVGNTSSGLGPESTIADLIAVWAPSQDGNNTDAYLADVLKKTGFSASMKLHELLD